MICWLLVSRIRHIGCVNQLKIIVELWRLLLKGLMGRKLRNVWIVYMIIVRKGSNKQRGYWNWSRNKTRVRCS